MKISLQWLREYVAWNSSAEELAANLTCLGLNVEALEEFALSFPQVVVAKVLKVAPHPNADRLSLCSVYDGRQTLSVVCGAPNVRKGLNVLLARPGAELPGIGRIKKTRIRGVESIGMICSSAELDLGSDTEGIMELEPDLEPGSAADELYGYRDITLDIEVTPNRPDWLSHLGIAREVAALGKGKVSMPATWIPPKGGAEQLDFGVEIEDFGDCPRYTLHGARNVAVKPSPAFMQNRLRAIGARPINNVVDITNYVLYELGQPLHAFDRARLSGSRIIVRRAAEKTKFATLDGVQHQLGRNHLVIADSSGAIAVAGVMGGLESEVTAATQDVLLESAFFSPIVVRQGARSLGLMTESSYRFEREADWYMVEKAAHRALYLLQQHAGAHIVPDWADRQSPDRSGGVNIPLRIKQVNRLLGTQLDAGQTVELLQRLSLNVAPVGKASERADGAARVSVEVPSYRRDLHQEVDLIEEIARIHGYDVIPDRGQFRGGHGEGRRRADAVWQKIRRHLVSIGFCEIVTSSFWSQQDLDRLGLDAEDPRRQCLSVVNPHHGGDVFLRTSLLPSLLQVAQHNINADNRLPLRLFQINKVFWPMSAPGSATGSRGDDLLPAEPEFLQLGLAGKTGTGWGDLPGYLIEMKGVIESMAALLRLPLSLKVADGQPYFRSGRQWEIVGPGREIMGFAGEVDGGVLERFEIDLPLVSAELAMDRLLVGDQPARFRPFSRFPSVKRDLSLIAPERITYRQVEATVLKAGGPLLESMEPFDIYKGKGLPKGVVAIGIRLKFRSDRGNLKGKTVDKTIGIITQTLADELSIDLRS